MTRYTAFRCPVEILRHARSIADGERRTLSNYIVRLLERDWIQHAATREQILEKDAAQRLHRAPYTR